MDDEVSPTSGSLDGTLTSRDRKVAYLDGTPVSEGDLYREGGAFDAHEHEEEEVHDQDKTASQLEPPARPFPEITHEFDPLMSPNTGPP